MEVSGRKAKKPSVSVTEASHEDFERWCDPCSTEGHQLPVAGFCVDCQHYLCKKCYKCHCRPLPMKNHVLLDSKEMPYQKTRTLIKDMCPNHEGKSIKYFCKQHNQLGCSVCMTTGHRGCDDVNYIADISKEIEDSAEYKKFIMKIKETKEKIHFNKSRTEDNISKSKTCFSAIMENVKILRKNLNAMFGELEKKIEQEAKYILDVDLGKVSIISNACDQAIQEIQKLNSDIEVLKQSKQYEQLFIKMKKSQTDINALEDSVAKMKEGNKIRHFEFMPDDQIKNILGSLKVFGQLQLRTPKDIRAMHVQDIKVSQNSNSWISGSTFMSDGQLVVIDYKHDTVILVNTQQNKATSELQLPDPLDITETVPGELAVTLMNKQVIQFVSVSDTLSKDREVKVNGLCQGIVCYLDKLAVTFKKPSKVEIMEMDGTVLNVISTDSSGGRLFSDPRYIAISPDHTTLYVSDWDNDSLTSLTLEGEVMATYKDSDLKFPTGVCVDRDGIIYLCGFGSRCVHQITADGEKLQILLNKTDGVIMPYSIAYSDQENKLHIGMLNNSNHKVFHLKY